VSSGGVFLEPSTNNVVEYSVIIELLHDAISHGVWYLEVRLDSQLVVCQLNNSYRVRNPTLLDNSYGYNFWNDTLILLLIIIYLEVLIMYLMHI
jgi:ribonuclease HI